MQSLSNLNNEQELAARHRFGPLLILAGAGAGKTKTITHRVLNLIKAGVSPHEILAITFTNKAAKEMRERVFKLIEEDKEINLPISINEKPFVSTFHALGVHILKENSARIGLTRHFTIYDRSDSLRAVKNAIKDLNLDPKQWDASKMLSIISRWKGDGVSLFDYSEKATENYLDRTLLLIWEKYESTLKKENALDFDDLLLKTFQTLRDYKDVRNHYNAKWKYIHIDEYQDTNKVQYDTAKLLAGDEKNICVVGDIDQSIYSWRGADFKNIMRFEKDFPNLTTILLEKNYRSTKKILRAANQVIEKNTLRKEKNLYTENAEGEDISLFGAYDEGAEALYVTEKIGELIQGGVSPKEIAVLYRANFQSRILEEACLTNKIPYEVLGVRFFERMEVKNILSYLKYALSRDNINDLSRIINFPQRGIGKVGLAKILSGEINSLPQKTKIAYEDFQKLISKIEQNLNNKKLSEVIYEIFIDSGMKNFFEEDKIEGEDRTANIYELIVVAEKYDILPNEEAVETFLTDAALASDQDDMKEDRQNIKLMTVHAAKGLEFDYVFITGLEEGLFPHEKPDGGRKKLEESEEERRLFYVALTRARKKLYLTYASVRSMFGSRVINIPSSFIDDIAPEILASESREDGNFHGKVIYLE